MIGDGGGEKLNVALLRHLQARAIGSFLNLLPFATRYSLFEREAEGPLQVKIARASSFRRDQVCLLNSGTLIRVDNVGRALLRNAFDTIGEDDDPSLVDSTYFSATLVTDQEWLVD
jgi:hypothetical protein